MHRFKIYFRPITARHICDCWHFNFWILGADAASHHNGGITRRHFHIHPSHHMLDLRETTAGTVGAICNVYAGLPLDVAKVRLQTQGPRGIYTGLSDVLAKTARQEGVRALWKGATPALSSAILENSVLFTAQGAIKRLVFADTTTAPLPPLHEASLGAAAGVFASVAITPSEVIKCRLQTTTHATSIAACVRHVWTAHGPRGFLQGLPAVLLRDVPFGFCFFGAYQLYTSQLMALQGVDSRRELHPMAVVLAGGAAGSTGWAFVFPADVIKSRMQVGTTGVGFAAAVRHVWQTQGLRGFYRGWSAAVLRSFPADGSLFLGVEMTHRVFGWMAAQDASRFVATLVAKEK
ncbi:Aste57867_24531 [Aphanomyces stellatus]|uniref:Aste57867_24531 protein n=1 Tax=Aphanomyces stellatus TaxID=120398 RepID=A0A485LSK5_9STRA|nr:hypothetical protein As57867_024454 [Aphanomyces stellatus]VFU01170.1 Aste57867_24531 [Aphanomyces stellatus]